MENGTVPLTLKAKPLVTRTNKKCVKELQKAFDNNAKEFERANLQVVINCKTRIVDLEQEKINTLIREMNDKCDTITTTVRTDPEDRKSQLDNLTAYQNIAMETFKELLVCTQIEKVFQSTFDEPKPE